jgi:hypothetical protein
MPRLVGKSPEASRTVCNPRSPAREIEEMHEATRRAVPPTSLYASEVDPGTRDDWSGVKGELAITNLCLVLCRAGRGNRNSAEVRSTTSKLANICQTRQPDFSRTVVYCATKTGSGLQSRRRGSDSMPSRAGMAFVWDGGASDVAGWWGQLETRPAVGSLVGWLLWRWPCKSTGCCWSNWSRRDRVQILKVKKLKVKWKKPKSKSD